MEELYELRSLGLCHEFVKKQRGRWNDSEWVEFLVIVRRAGYGHLSDGDVGLELEKAKDEFWQAYRDLRRAFVNRKRGHWNHADWVEFLAEVHGAGYLLLTADEVGLDLERDKSNYWAELRRLRSEGLCRDFVRKQQGHWSNSDWLEFLGEVRKAGYVTLSDGLVGLELEKARDEFWHAYQELGRAFVDKKKAAWNHADWVRFLAEIRKAGYLSLTDADVGLDLEKAKSEYLAPEKRRQTVDLAAAPEKVRIRIECGENFSEETFLLDGTSLLDMSHLQDIPLSLPDTDGAGGGVIRKALGTILHGSAADAIGIGSGLSFGVSVPVLWEVAQHTVHTVKVMINTPVGGAVLTMIAKQVYGQVSEIVKKKFESRAKEVEIVLLGPDGKPIKP